MNYPQNPEHSTAEGQAVQGEGSSFEEILSQFEQEHKVPGRQNQAVEGTVVAVNADAVVVDIGKKTEGMLTPEELLKATGESSVKIGDKLVVTVSGFDQQGYYRLSAVRVERPKDWSGLQRAYDEKAIIAGTVTESVKGGLRVDIGVPAFLPASRSGTRDLAEMEKLVGQEIQCKILELKIDSEDVVLDRKVVLAEEEARAKEAVFNALQEGAVVQGTVRSLTDFGAFVDLGGVDGLLHVTDIAWYRVAKPADVLSMGESLEVKILKVNPATRRISLGLKQLRPDPWTLAGEKYKVGERVQGKVTRLTDFGAFVELEPGIEGLIHLSEMSWSRKVRKASDVLKPNETVEVAILGVNGADRRISLGLKQALGDPWEDAATKFAPGTVVEGPVRNLAKFGAFVELAEGVEGMIHIGDITGEKRLNHPSEELKEGQVVKAVVLEADREKRRIRLGMKQLQPTSADEYIAEHKVGDVVTGRVVDGARNRAKVELGEGVFAACKVAVKTSETGKETEKSSDISSLTAMLAAKWKQGGGESSSSGGDDLKAGQVRSFRILLIDPKQKHIEVEVA